MMNFSPYGTPFDFFPGFIGGIAGMFLFIVIVEIALKGWAMWRAARMEKPGWFIALLILNTVGIFPVIFLLITHEEYRRKFPAQPASPV